MPNAHIQLVKWSFPAFALIIGLLWYKRRRVDRGDPGGFAKNLAIGSTSSANHTPVQKSKSSAQLQGTPSLYESGIHVDESFTANSSTHTKQDPLREQKAGQKEEIAQSPRKVSLCLDIPTRKPASEPIAVSIVTSGVNNRLWSAEEDDEQISKTMEIQLGSNPRVSNFEMVARSLAGSSLDGMNVDDGKMLKIFENVDEEVEDGQPQEQNDRQEVQTVADTQTACGYVENESGVLVESTGEDGAKVQVLSERDSANHSPVSAVLEGSVTDEARSEGSTDSGKGGSIKGHTKDNAATPEIYEFSVPNRIIGRLIGRNGSFLQSIRNKTNGELHITLEQRPMHSQRVCSMKGTREAITIALDMIRRKFPQNNFPHLTLERLLLPTLPEEVPWVTEVMQLSLVEGVNNDVMVCHIVKPNRLFVQLPTHPAYPFLRILDANMTQLYNTTESPLVPDQLNKGMIFVAKLYDMWVRVYVENPDPLGQRHLVRLVDHGGYWTFSNAEMRKIRADYLTLPFQAIEIFLANTQPVDGEWKQEAYNVVAQMCAGVVGQAQIEGYIDIHTYVNLYLNIPKHGVISLADELIARGYAEPIPLEVLVPEEVVPLPVQTCV